MKRISVSELWQRRWMEQVLRNSARGEFWVIGELDYMLFIALDLHSMGSDK